MKSLPTRQLPERPDLEQLRRQAKELLEDVRRGAPDATAEANRFYRDVDKTRFALHHAQLILARSYGFDSWPKLKAFVDGITVKRLVEAVRGADVAGARDMLCIRPELVNREAPSSHGHMPLHYAVLARMPAMVRMLMESGADARTTTAGIYALRDAASPLGIARERGYEEIVAIIDEEERRRTAGRLAGEEGVPELRHALEAGDDEALAELLRRRPDLASFPIAGSRGTLLHLASALLLPRTAARLLSLGADVNGQAPDGWTPLDVAGSGGGLTHYPGVHRNPNESAETMTMIHFLQQRGAKVTARSAVILGDEASLHRIAAEEEVITPRDDRGWLLRLAVDCNYRGMLKLLLDLGLDPDARVRVEESDRPTFSWGMPLYQCARYGKHTLAEMLLEHGADPNAQVYASGTPLSEAYGQRDDAMVALLERYGGKSNASMAGMYRRADLARRLLEQFGDASLPDDGFSSGPVAEQLLGSAARGGDPEILRMAMEQVYVPNGDPRWNGLLQAPLEFWNHWIGPWCHPEWDRSTYLTCFRMILDKCGPPNAPGNCGATILHQIVVMGDHVRPAERLAFATAALDAGARMDFRDDLLKSTPLGWACRWGREDLVRLFLDRGADAAETDAEPWATPLTWAEKKGHTSIAAMLRAKGVSK